MKRFKLFTLPIFTYALVCAGLSTQTFAIKEEVKPDNFISEERNEGPIFYPAAFSLDSSDEPYYSTQNTYTFSSMNYAHVHKRERGDSVKVAVIDSGLNYTHEDFKDTSNQYIINSKSRSIEYSSGWYYYEFSNNASHLTDSLGHGSNVASVIASQINSVGCAGIAPNVELYVYKVTNSNNGYEWTAINNALQYCIDNDIDIINMSFQAYEHAVTYNGSTMSASSGCSSVMTSAINACYNAGITLVAAAGNYNTSEPSYPASNDHVISVGALAESSTTTKAGYSNTYGIDLVAPGTVYVADKGSNNAYKKTSGTSFASPIVTAAIALYKEKHPSATPSDIETALYASCDAISANPSWAGNGRLNLLKFLGEDVPESVGVTNVVDCQLDMEVGEYFDLDVDVTANEDVSDTSVNYSLYEDSGVISVSNTGRITALTAGTDTVIVESNANPNAFDLVEVTVTSSSSASLTLSPQVVSIEEGFTQQLTASTSPAGAITFSSNNNSVATVNSSGLITAVAPGNATISASANGITETCSVTVTKSPLSSISVSGMTTSYAIGSSFSFDGTCTATYHNGSSKTVTPTSVSSPNMSTEGSKSITVTYTEDGVTKTDSYTITVSEIVSTGVVDFTNSNSSDTDDNGYEWAAHGTTSTSSYLSLKRNGTYVSSDLIYVDIDKTVSFNIRMRYYGGSQASVNIYAVDDEGTTITNVVNKQPTSNNNKSYTGTLTFNEYASSPVSFVVNVTGATNDSKYIGLYSLEFSYTPGVKPPEVTAISLDKQQLNFDLYGTKVGTITPTVTYEEGADTTVSYTMSSSNIVSLSSASGSKDQTITVTALAVGTVTITATCGTHTATCSVTVVDTTPIPVTSLTLDKSSTSLIPNATVTITATIGPNNATNKTLNWISSNSSIAEITTNNGSSVVVTARGSAGQSATITATTTDGSDISKTCTISIIAEVVQVGTEIATYPETVPFKGTFDTSGIVVKKVMSDGNKYIVTPTSTNYTINTGVLGEQTISATFGGFTGTAKVKVTNNGASGNVGEDTEQAASVSTSFTSSSWAGSGESWTSGKAGNGYSNGGVQVSTGASGANATTAKSYTKISSVVVTYCTNGSSGAGSIAIQIGSNSASSQSVTKNGGTTGRDLTYNFATPLTGTVKITVTCTSNSIYVKGVTINYASGVSYPATPEEQAIAWATYFNGFTAEYCDVSGANSDLDGLSSIWGEVEDEYDYMTDESKIALLTSSNSNVVKALTTYRVIILKYDDFDNFIKDGQNVYVTKGASFSLFKSSDTSVLLIVISSLVAASLLLSYLYFRKKK